MKLFAFGRESMLWAHAIKLGMLAIPMILVTTLELYIRDAPHLRLGRRMIGSLSRALLTFINLVHNQFLNRGFLSSKCIVVDYEDYRPIGTSLDGFVAFAWVCEKMKINVKIKKPTDLIWRHFENDKLINNANESMHKFQPSMRKKFFENDVAWFGTFFISSTYGHKILSKLVISPYLERHANQWIADNLKGDWIAVHYRGTDVVKKKNTQYQKRYRIDLEPYITYLKEVIDDQCSIFVCSDQAQFIDKMHTAFPTRAFSRDIERSYDESPIHRHDIIGKRTGIDNFDQETDALIDLLILAKAKLIYTVGSGFVDVTRYLNPQIKIISLDQRRIGQGENNLPIPRKDLYDRLCRFLK